MINRLFRKKSLERLRRDIATDSGMLCVWDYQSFSHIHDYDTWEPELCENEDIEKHISKGTFIPLNLGDGVFSVDVRLKSPDSMNDREREYLLVPSQPYKLKTNGRVCVSGLEHVGRDMAPQSITVDVDSGEYAVFVNLIDWNQEPGVVDDSGNPTDKALPDMIVFITPSTSESKYRGEIETFRKEDALR